MQTTEQLRGRIDSLQDLRSIVGTMKSLAAVSIRQYEAAVHALHDYYRTTELGLAVALADLRLQAPERASGSLGAVVIGSDHGLCGRFNEDLVAFALDAMAHHPEGERRAIAVGARAEAGLVHGGQPVEAVYPTPGSADRITGAVQAILARIDRWRREAGVDEVYLYYHHHRPGAHSEPTGLRLLPVDLRRFRSLKTRRWPSRRLPTFSMDHRALLSALLRQYFFVSIYRACAESLASENASRLQAMQAAQDNLDEHLADVRAQFRQSRQDEITAELLDVVAGFEALTGD